jgi:4-amino-4-deoxy-L-arabinose transferase-like glycosyltransferase
LGKSVRDRPRPQVHTFTDLTPWAVLVALLLCAAAVFLVYDHTREDALSADEPIHILSGYFAVAKRSAVVNIEHPPLMKVLSGLALSTLVLAPPPQKIPMGNLFVVYGPDFFYRNRVPVDRILAVARAPFLAVLAALLLLVFSYGRARYGSVPAVFATALLALDPNLLAHAGVVHTDLGAALAFLATVIAWEAARRQPSPLRLLAAAICLGLALVTKFSAVYLVPILLLQTLLAAKTEAGGARRLLASLGRLAAVGAISLLVVLGVYAPVTQGMDGEHQKAIIREKVGALGQAPALAERIAEFADVSKPLAHYFGGLASVVRQNAVGGGITYLNGKLSTEGFPSYFFVAFAVKSTLAFLAVTLAVLGAALTRRKGLADEWRLFGVPVLVLFLASVGTTYNIGIRHLLPVYPFLALFGAALFARAWESRGASTRARVACGVWLVLPLVSAVEVARIHPHELSYFNALGGGPSGGARILTDSNVDWGLDLRRLKTELARRGVKPEDLTVSYFGGDNVSYRLGVPDFSALPEVRGRLLAISVFMLTAGPEFSAYHGQDAMAEAQRRLQDAIARARPAGRVGHSIYLFELPEKETP